MCVNKSTGSSEPVPGSKTNGEESHAYILKPDEVRGGGGACGRRCHCEVGYLVDYSSHTYIHVYPCVNILSVWFFSWKRVLSG